MSEVFDPGWALFAGLNCIPKRSLLTEYGFWTSADAEFAFFLDAELCGGL
jgi:hypothetical protein